MGRLWTSVAVGAAALLVAASRQAWAQEDALVARCGVATVGAGQEAQRFCNLVAQAIEIAQPAVGLAATGGNPVPGTASTLGMRIGALPRFTIAVRTTGVFTELPQVLDFRDRDEIDAFVPSLNADASIGIFSGFSPAPTVGGIGAIDALASLGVLPLPGGDGFDDSPWTWALGLRLGILRESFTLPGISVSAMYRRVGDFTLGDPALRADDAFFDGGIGIWSLRAALGKRISFLGFTVGAGYDHYSSDVSFGFVNPSATGPATFRLAIDDFENDRFMLFGNVSWTLLILHLVGEIGWQQGGDPTGVLPAGLNFDPEGGNFFGSLALRLSI